jgi:hypothetical protein
MLGGKSRDGGMGSSSAQMQEVRSGGYFGVCADYVYAHITYRATAIANKLGIEFALIHRRKSKSEAECMEILVGDVRNKANAPSVNGIIFVNLVSPGRNHCGWHD